MWLWDLDMCNPACITSSYLHTGAQMAGHMHMPSPTLLMMPVLPCVTLARHAGPLLTALTPKQSAMQALPYARPSEPQTCMAMTGGCSTAQFSSC